MNTFAKRFKQLRLDLGLSQQALAEQLKISKSSVNMYERGEREPGFETLEAIADFFNVDMNFLIGRESNNANGELIDLYIHGAKTWASDFRFSERQKARINEYLADSTAKLKEVINCMAESRQVDGKILMSNSLQKALDDISHWTANALMYVNEDYSEDPHSDNSFVAAQSRPYEIARAYYGIIQNAKRHLARETIANPNLPSCDRIKYLFDETGIDKFDLINALSLSHDELDSWIGFNDIPSRTVIDRFCGVFYTFPGMLCNASELEEYYCYDKHTNCAILYDENGHPISRKLSKEQLNAITAILMQMPETSD